MYYSINTKTFISRKTNEEKPKDVITLVNCSPKLVIKQFVENYPKSKRTDNPELIMKVWKGFLFRWRLQLKDLKLQRKIKNYS